MGNDQAFGDKPVLSLTVVFWVSNGHSPIPVSYGLVAELFDVPSYFLWGSLCLVDLKEIIDDSVYLEMETLLGQPLAEVYMVWDPTDKGPTLRSLPDPFENLLLELVVKCIRMSLPDFVP